MKSPPRSTFQTKDPIPDFSRRPHRIHLEQSVEVTGFSKLRLRPIRLDDESKMVDFHRGISTRSIFLRYFGYLGLDRRTSHERLVRVCTNTPEVYSIVIEQPAHPRTPVTILAVGRLLTTPRAYVATLDILIGDEANIPKLSTILVNRLIRLSRAFRFRTLASRIMGIDQDAIDVFQSLDFKVQDIGGEGIVQVSLKL